MIHLPASVRVYLCLAACDMRKSFYGLHALMREHLELDVFAGHLRPHQDFVLGCVTNVSENLQSCTEDGRRPPGVGFQELASKPPGAAASKRRGGERPRKRRPKRASGER